MRQLRRCGGKRALGMKGNQIFGMSGKRASDVSGKGSRGLGA